MFLKDIEGSAYALRLHNFSASLMENRRRTRGFEQNQPEEQGSIEVNLEIGLIDLKK